MSIDFNKKNILVIGGSSGIGRGIAECFVNYNANVCITGTRDSINDMKKIFLKILKNVITNN